MTRTVTILADLDRKITEYTADTVPGVIPYLPTIARGRTAENYRN
ncbi:hypothetical protein ACT3SZ_15420 [Corynebacterium sp. AOP40-9SA-29]